MYLTGTLNQTVCTIGIKDHGATVCLLILLGTAVHTTVPVEKAVCLSSDNVTVLLHTSHLLFCFRTCSRRRHIPFHLSVWTPGTNGFHVVRADNGIFKKKKRKIKAEAPAPLNTAGLCLSTGLHYRTILLP